MKCISKDKQAVDAARVSLDMAEVFDIVKNTAPVSVEFVDGPRDMPKGIMVEQRGVRVYVAMGDYLVRDKHGNVWGMKKYDFERDYEVSDKKYWVKVEADLGDGMKNYEGTLTCIGPATKEKA